VILRGQEDEDSSDDEIDVPINFTAAHFYSRFYLVARQSGASTIPVTCAWNSTCDVKPEYFDIGNGVEINRDQPDDIEPSTLPRPPELLVYTAANFVPQNLDDIDTSTLPRPPELLDHTAANFVPQNPADIDTSTLPRPPESRPPEFLISPQELPERWADIDIEPHEPVRQRYQQQQQHQQPPQPQKPQQKQQPLVRQRHQHQHQQQHQQSQQPLKPQQQLQMPLARQRPDTERMRF
jgi:hypothetical protein